ncbi:hypothetical protein AM228_20625 [Planktothricoides sp. SR001]|nr:hypothetical protein AM228_20625 [Planktothricoides sp. SR001]
MNHPLDANESSVPWAAKIMNNTHLNLGKIYKKTDHCLMDRFLYLKLQNLILSTTNRYFKYWLVAVI